MTKQICSYVNENVLEKLKTMGFSGYKAVQEGLQLLLEREQMKEELKELHMRVSEEKFKLDRIIKEQQKVEFDEKALTPRQESALRNGENVPPMSKMANAQPTDTIPSELTICQKIWMGKTFMGSVSRALGYDVTLTNEQYDELYTRSKRVNREISSILHSNVQRDYSGGFVGFSIDTVKMIDRLLHVNSFSDDQFPSI